MEITTVERKTRKISKAVILDPPAQIEQLDGTTEGNVKDKEDGDDICELLITKGQGKDSDYRHLPLGVTQPPRRVRHPIYGVGVFEEMGQFEDCAVYDFPSMLVEVCTSCKICA